MSGVYCAACWLLWTGCDSDRGKLSTAPGKHEASVWDELTPVEAAPGNGVATAIFQVWIQKERPRGMIDVHTLHCR